MGPARCVLIFPGPAAKPLHEVLDADVRHLVFVDATWRFAREMVAASEQLTLLRCAVLTPPAGIKPVFVVRKPLLLSSESATADNSDRSDGAKDDEQRWGYSTAEAVAPAVDEVQRLRTNSVVEGS